MGDRRCVQWVLGFGMVVGLCGCAEPEDEPGYETNWGGQQGVAQIGACNPPDGVAVCTCPGGAMASQRCDAVSLMWTACDCPTGQGTGGALAAGGGTGGAGGGAAAGGSGGAGGNPVDLSGSGGAPGGGDMSGDASNGGDSGGPFDDGSGAVVSAPFACGASGGFGIGATNVTIGGRDVLIEYPCDHREGADMIFILNLHGTMANEDFKLYQHGYFAVHNHIASHNFIVAAPKAIGSQWGNEGGEADTAHLREVVDYVYSTFAQFNIRAMWIGGHSWGSMYTRTFVCDGHFADEVKGAILMSGNPGPPDCSDRLSLIGTLAQDDITPTNVEQAGVAAGHGCGAMQTDMVGNNVHDVWPACNPGFVHANYLMLGKGHSDSMDAEVVLQIADEIRAATP